MILGAFSVSLSVSDLQASRTFYEKLGFSVFAGEPEKRYYIMKNRATLIGLFQGMFEGSMLTFNPGWDQNASPLAEYDDVREIQRRLAAGGIAPDLPLDTATAGPGRIMLHDPDGNVILIDQHV